MTRTPEQQREYYQRNREALVAYQREYMLRNRDQINAKRRADAAARRAAEPSPARPAPLTPEQKRERAREYRRRWRLANPDKIAEANARRRGDPATIQKHREYYARNRGKADAYQREYLRRNPGLQRTWGLARRHGMRPEDWAAMWDAQDRRCYLCGEELSAERAQTDHDHACCPPGRSCQVCRRGLACEQCNYAIGLVKEDAARLRRMADAIEAAQLAVAQRMAVRAAGQIQLPIMPGP